MNFETHGAAVHGDGRRTLALEAARALVVIGVVLNHAVDGALKAGLLDPTSPVARINAALYVFRMPALAFLVGVFIPSGVERRGSARYLRRRVSTAVHLYLLWFYLQSAVELAANSVKNSARDPYELLTPWLTFGQLWFLPFLAVATGVVVVCRCWCSAPAAMLSVIATATLAVVTWGWNPRLVGLGGLSLVVFAVLGAVVGLPRLSRGLRVRPLVWALLGAGAAATTFLLVQAGAVPPTLGNDRPSVFVVAISAGAAVSGIVAVLAAAVLLVRIRLAARLASVLGPRTLSIFLGHVIVVAGTRVVLVHLGVTDPLVVLTVAIALGVAIPVVVSRWAEARSPWKWLFDAPVPVRGR